MKIRNNKGPNTDSCGTPYVSASLKSEITPLVVVYCFLFDKYDSNHLRALPLFHSVEILTTEYHDRLYQKPFSDQCKSHIQICFHSVIYRCILILQVN